MRSNRTTAATFGLRLLAILALLITANLSETAPVSAQSYGGMVIGAVTCEAPDTSCRSEIGAQFTVTTEDGAYVGACTVEGDPHDNSHIAACVVAFPFEITGAVVVTENVDSVTPGYAPAENPILWEFPDPVTRPSHDVVFRNLPLDGSGAAAVVSNIAIVPTENGRSITDACFVLTTFGNIGCDDNRDGKITFRDVPLGAYTVHQTANLGPGRHVNDFTIQVTGAASADGFERFGATIIFSQTSSSSSVGSSDPSGAVGAKDISLITRDPRDGHVLTETCYELLNYSDIGCDDNGDGQVKFAAIPPGTYTVHQTQTPAGYPTINDFPIVVDDQFLNVPVGYIVRQAKEQNAPGTRNVSVVFIDSRTYTKLVSNICMEFVGGSDIGCDDDVVDGQIDFQQVETGAYRVDFSNLPYMWQLMVDDVVGPSYNITAGTGPLIIYVGVYVPDDASAGAIQPVSGTSSASGSSGSGGVSGSASSSGLAGASDRAWTAAIWVRLCDAPQGSGTEIHCEGGAGIVVNFSLASGEFLGSCTTGEPYLTPWGPNTVSDCAVEGMPFNADIVASQDPSTIPPGYAPYSEASVVHMGDDPPPFQDGPLFSITNVRIDSGSIGSSGISNSNNSGSATLLMTFRGCPEGFDPATDDYFANCTIPLDAPDASYISWGEGGSAKHITELERQYDGAYIFDASPYQMSVALSGLAPVVRDAYQVIGSDSTNGYVYIVGLSNGETRELFVFYYFYP